MYNSICTRTTVNSEKKENSFKTFSLKSVNQRFFYLLMFLMFAPLVMLKAQTSYYWDFTNANATITAGSGTNLTVDTFKRGNSLGTVTTALRTNATTSSGYAGATAGNNIGNSCKIGAFHKDSSAYFEIKLTPASGYTVQLTSLSFGRRNTSTAPKNFEIRTDKDNYATSLGGDTMTTTNTNWIFKNPSITSVTSTAGTALTVRIYGYNGAGAAGNGVVTWKLDDVTLNVTIASAETTPAAPTSGGNQSVCTGGSIPNLSATAPSGAVVDWYAASSGGSVLSGGSGTNTYATGQTAAGTYTYYAQSRNSPGSLVSSSRTAVTLTITQTVTPTISASVDDNTPTSGQTLNFSSSITNGGGTPGYQWYKNLSAIGSANNSTYSTSSFATLDSFYVQLTSNAACATSATANSNSITITVDNSACSGTPPTANAAASSTNVCSGGSSNLSLTGLGGATGYTFQWQKSTTQGGTYSDISGETNATYSATGITTAFWYRCNVTCSNSSVTTASNAIQINVTTNVTPLVTIATTTNPSCNGSSVTYTATPVNGGATPSYAWYLNGTVVSGLTGSTYTTSGLADGNTIYAILTSSFACVTKTNDTSSTVTHNVTATVAASVSIASSANPSCAGASVTFTATPINGGTPTYQWYNGVSAISGQTNSTYTSSSITTGSSITVVMTSTATCATGSPATSNAVVQTVSANVTPTMTIASNNNPVCTSGSPNATFSISPVNAGVSPVYAWYLNGSVVSAQTGTTYTRSPVVNGDSVYATMTSSLACVTTPNATSNGIKETIVSPSAPTVSITASPGTSIFDGTNVTFSATTTFGGTTPHYQWKLNGNNVGTDTTTYSSTTLLQNDAVTCVLTSNYTCLTASTATSNSLTITILGNSPFTPGNLIVYRAGDSVNNLVTNAMPIFLAEYTTSGNLVQAKRISKNASGVNSIYCSGSSTSEGMLTLNTNGTNLAIPGYYSTLNASGITGSTSAAINRVVALVDVNQNVDTTTRLSDWASAGSPRGAAASGNSIYVTGSQGGTRYAAKGTVGTSILLSSTVTNMRNVAIFNGQLYASDNSGTTNRLSTIGTGLPTTSGQTMTNLPGTPTNNQPYGFFFADLSSSVAGLDVLYVCDDNTSTITKYSLVSGTWTSNGTVTATSVKGLTASVSGTTVTLYGTAVTTGTVGTYIYSQTDASGYNGAFSGTATKLVDRTGVTLMAFRGIAFAPTSIVTQPSNTSVCTDATTSMSVVMTTGTSSSIYTYQWQISSDNGSTWNNVSNSGPYTNAATATLGISNPSVSLNNTQYRCQVTYMGTTVLTTNAAVLTVTTTVTPSVSISTASDTVCSGNSVTFTATGTNAGSSPIYSWKKNGSSVGSSSSITFPGGTLSTGDTITCVLTANNACQTTATATSNKKGMYVKFSPAIGTTTGFTACNIGSVYGIYNTNTQGGGVWSSTNTAVATVTTSSNGGTGLVVPTGNGTTVLRFSKSNSNGCVSTASANVIVAAATIPNSITGTNNVCKGNTTQLSSTTSGGVWSTSPTSYATINSTGLLTSISTGTSIVKYTVTNANGCSASTSYSVTNNALPLIPGIGYQTGTQNPQVGAAGGFCIGRIFTLVGTPSGGVWSSSNTAVATVTSPAGQVEIVGVGTTGLRYTYTNGNGCTNSRTITGVGVTCASRGVNGVNNGQLSIDNTQFTIYPNPAKSFISLNVKTLIGTGSIVVTDLYGKQVKGQILSLGNNTIDIATLCKGIYMVSIITNEGKSTKKLIVE